MSLLELQRDFRRQLIDAAPPPADFPEARGLAVYHNAYRVQLTDCLAETFAKVHAWLGGEAFVDAARAHIEASPPSGWTLAAYGSGFERTLAALYPDDPEVAELARLEWLLSRAFEDVDAGALSADGIAGVDWDRAVVAFVPSLRLTPARTNAGAIWSALAADVPPPAAAMLDDPAHLLVWRQGFTPCFRTVEPIEFDAIMAVATGAAFAELCADLVRKSGEASGVAQAGAMLGQWFRDGLVARVTV